MRALLVLFVCFWVFTLAGGMPTIHRAQKVVEHVRLQLHTVTTALGEIR